MGLAESLLAIALGVSLAAAAGLRIFLPLLVVALAARAGVLELAPAFDWVGTLPAIATLAAAALVEIAAYYLPGIDNLLDTIAAPLALVAGTVLVVAPLWDLPPLVKWTIAIVAGGGAAALTQGASSLLRVKSTLATGGAGNALVSTGELGGAVLLAVLALLLPVAGLMLVLVLVIWLVRRLVRRAGGAGRASSAG